MEQHDELSRDQLAQRLRDAEDLLAKREAELKALRQSEERDRIAAEAAGLGIFDVDLATGSVYWSPAMRRVLGVSPDAPTPSIGEVPALVHPDDVELVRPLFEPPFTAPDSDRYGAANRIVWPDGSVRWVEAKGRVIFAGEGGSRRPARICGALVDITERKRAEEEARQRLAEIEDLYRTAPVGLCVLDRDLRWVRINERLAQMNGFSAAEHIGKRLRDLLPALADAVEPGARGVLESRQPHLNIEVVSETPAAPGVTRSWLEHLLPILDEHGKAVGLSIVVEETTERHRAETALRESEERLRLAQQSARLGIWEWQARTGEVRATGVLEASYGFPDEASSGGLSSFSDRVHPEDLPRVQRAIDAAVAAREPFDTDFRVRLPDGTTRWLNCKGSAAYDSAGNPERILGVNIDITDRKQAEEALREADRRKDEFLATLAHELRNPLVPIRNAAEILALKASQDATLQKLCVQLDRQVQHLVRLVDDLLDVGRISRGKLRLRKERVDLLAVIDQALDVVRPLIDAAGHSLEMSLPPRPVHLDADPVRLAQVLCNLLDNACKFSDRGGLIRLSAECDGNDVVVTVEDSGSGIAPEHLGGVFGMFAQGSSTPERVRSGLGIGLALTRGLVEMHGGRIEAQSEGQGKGSRFTVRLPTTAERVPPPDESSRETTRRTDACRILIADDHPDVLESLAMLLEIQGHEVATARDGLEACEVAGHFRPDLVLLDLGMPKLDGFGACRRIREQPWGRNLTVIALSGWAQDSDRCKSQEAGFDDHLVKPVAPAALRAVIAKAQGLKA